MYLHNAQRKMNPTKYPRHILPAFETQLEMAVIAIAVHHARLKLKLVAARIDLLCNIL